MTIIERVRARWAWLLAAVLVGGALAVVVSTGPDAGRLDTEPGQFVGLNYLDDDVTEGADDATLSFPRGELRISLGTPRSAVDDQASAGYRAPEDGSLLSLDTGLQAVIPYSVARPGLAAEPDPVLRLTVVADGTRYPIRSAPQPGFEVSRQVRGVLAVAGRPRDVRVEAELDGVRQTVRPATGARQPGRAAGLYRQDDGRESADRLICGSLRLSSGYRPADPGEPPECSVSGAVRTAYVDGLGWAAPGRTWQLVVLTVDDYFGVYRTGDSTERVYRSVRGDDDLTVTFDGRPTVGSPRVNAGNRLGRSNAVAVAQVAVDAAPVSVGIVSTFHRLRSRDAGTPIAPDVSLSWTVKLS